LPDDGVSLRPKHAARNKTDLYLFVVAGFVLLTFNGQRLCVGLDAEATWAVGPYLIYMMRSLQGDVVGNASYRPIGLIHILYVCPADSL